MYKKMILITGVVFLFVLGLSTNSNAQCVACYQSVEEGAPSCRTEIVFRNAHTGCGCDGGCDCSGSCESGALENFNYSPELDLENMTIPKEGFRLFVSGDLNFVEEEELTLAFVGARLNEKVLIGNSFGAYKVTNNSFIIYPLEKKNYFKVKNCSDEIIGIASRYPVDRIEDLLVLSR